MRKTRYIYFLTIDSLVKIIYSFIPSFISKSNHSVFFKLWLKQAYPQIQCMTMTWTAVWMFCSQYKEQGAFHMSVPRGQLIHNRWILTVSANSGSSLQIFQSSDDQWIWPTKLTPHPSPVSICRHINMKKMLCWVLLWVQFAEHCLAVLCFLWRVWFGTVTDPVSREREQEGAECPLATCSVNQLAGVCVCVRICVWMCFFVCVYSHMDLCECSFS